MSRRRVVMAAGLMLGVAAITTGCGRANDTGKMTELQRLKSGTLDVVVMSPRNDLRRGKDTFFIEFRSASDGSLVDVGRVRASATMPMPGMPMFGDLAVESTDVAGRYTGSSEFPMVGSWRITIEWDGSVGHGSVAFSETVQ